MTDDNKITFHSFTELVAGRAKVDSAEANAYIHQLVKTIGEGLEKGDSIHLYRFGRFHTTHIGEQAGSDPNSGAPLTIPDHTRVHFRPYSALRFAVNAPFRQLRIKELTPEKTAWRTRTGAYILLALVLLLLFLLGIRLKNWMSTQDASVVPSEKASGRIELAHPVREASVTSAPAPTIIAPALAAIAAAPAESETTPVPAPVETETTPTANASAATVVIVSPGDTLWSIASTAWDDPFWWPLIYAENRPDLSHRNPDLIDNGITLRIPVLTGTVNSPTAADLSLKTNAYRIVADDYRKLGSPRAAEYATVAARGFKE
jgi:nucleoid DNA-binding protein